MGRVEKLDEGKYLIDGEVTIQRKGINWVCDCPKYRLQGLCGHAGPVMEYEKGVLAMAVEDALLAAKMSEGEMIEVERTLQAAGDPGLGGGAVGGLLRAVIPFFRKEVDRRGKEEGGPGFEWKRQFANAAARALEAEEVRETRGSLKKVLTEKYGVDLGDPEVMFLFANYSSCLAQVARAQALDISMDVIRLTEEEKMINQMEIEARLNGSQAVKVKIYRIDFDPKGGEEEGDGK
jgi:hypothetical protein